MTQKELSTEEFSFSRVIDTSKEVFSHTDSLPNFTLDIYLEALSHDDSSGRDDEQIQIKAPSPADKRRLTLENILKRLSDLEVDGKDYVESYLRHQYRSHFQASTLKNTYSSLQPFLLFIKEKGKGGIEEVERGDLEAFVEHEQDGGLALSTVKLRLETVKAFLRFMIDKGVVMEEVFPWKLKIKLPEALPRAMDSDDVERLLGIFDMEKKKSQKVMLGQRSFISTSFGPAS